MNRKAQHGGVRTGAGRKASGVPTRTEQIRVLLTEDEAGRVRAHAEECGIANVGAWARGLILAAVEA